MPNRNAFKGSTVAIVTPFNNGSVDEAKLKELVEFQIQGGTNVILPCGTTGESPTLTHKEHDKVIEVCIEASDGRVPILAGTGSNCTKEAVELTQHAEKVGASAALVVSPYYNKPTQEGLYQHFKTIADSVKIPIILYNIQGRTAVNIDTSTVVRLATDCPNIIGVKEASGNIGQMQDVRLQCPKDFLLLSGDDALTLPLLSIGGDGVISVAANIIPSDIAKLIKAFNAGNIAEAQKMHYKLLPLIKSFFIETNPVPIKEAMSLAGLCSAEFRLPLCPMKEENRAKLKDAMTAYGLIQGANV